MARTKKIAPKPAGEERAEDVIKVLGVPEGGENGAELLDLDSGQPEPPPEPEMDVDADIETETDTDAETNTKGWDKPFHADDSDFKGDKDIRPTGRPLSDTPSYRPPPPVPTPPFRQWKSDATNPHQRSKAAFTWLNKLPAVCREQLTLYVYRIHPVLLVPGVDEETGKPLDFGYIDKIIGEQPFQDDNDLLNRYGCGSYRVVVNELEGRKKKGRKTPDKTVLEVWINNLGGSDFRSYPPTDRRIDDPTNVDLDWPANRSYVSYLKGRGLLPSEADLKREEEDMANTALVEKLVDRIGTEGKGKDPELLEKALSTSMDLIRRGSEEAIKTTRDANDYAQRVRDEAEKRVAQLPPAGGTGNSLKEILEVLEVVKSLGKEDSGEVAELRRQLADVTSQQISALRDEIKTLREARTAVNPSSPLAAVKEQTESLRMLREMLKEIKDDDEGDGAGGLVGAAASAGPKWFQQYAPLIQYGLQAFDTWNRMQMMRQGVPVPNPGAGMAGMGQPSPNPQPHPNPQPQALPPAPDGFPPELANLLMSINPALFNHLADTTATGTEFADWFISGWGEDMYRQICGFGVDGVMQALVTFPATGATVSRFPLERVKAFVEEFLNPKWGEGEEGNGEGPGDGKGPVNGNQAG